MPNDSRQFKIGLISAVLAHCMWGFFPLYWKLLEEIPAFGLACHRVIWAFMWLTFLVPILMAGGMEVSFREFRSCLANRRTMGLYVFAAAMLAINWLAFIWAVNNGQVLQASLGYYINPLLSILLGVIVLGERLELSQWLAVVLAAIGVTIMTVFGGGLPWASLAMACAFALYGLAKKKTPLPSLSGLWVEVTILMLPATAAVWMLAGQSKYASVEFTASLWLLLAGGGAITVIPLTLFAVSARRLPLSMVGVLQYIGPTLQFLVGTLINGEQFGRGRMYGFLCVWTGSILYLVSARRRHLKENPPQSSVPNDRSDYADSKTS